MANLSVLPTDTEAGSRQSLPSMTGRVPSASRAAGIQLAFDVITTLPAFEALEDNWNALFARSALPHHHFLGFNWNWHWQQHYVAGEAKAGAAELCLVTGHANGRLVLIWPLARVRRFGFTQVIWMGDPVTQYGDVLVEHGPLTGLWLKQSYDFVCRNLGGDALFLRKVRDDSNIAPLLEAEGITVTAQEEAPYIDLTQFETYEDYFTTFGKKARKNRRRHRRRMEEEGEIDFRFHEAGRQAGEIAMEAIRLKRGWLKERGLFSRAYATDMIDTFFTAACSSTDRTTSPHVTKWCVEGETAAIEVGFEHQGHHIAHIGVYHPKHERHSPGTLQMEDTIRSCIDRGLHRYDLMAPADDYKLQWCDRTMPVRDFAVPTSLLGQTYVALYLGFARRMAKLVMSALPTRLRRTITPLAARLAGRG